MKAIVKLCVVAVALPLLALTSCAGPAAPLSPAAQFALRSTRHPPRKAVQDAGEAYLAVRLLHPSSVSFANEFQSDGQNSTALCGWIKYRDKEGDYTPYRPFFVEFKAHSTIGSNQPFLPDDRLAGFCGNILANPPQ